MVPVGAYGQRGRGQGRGAEAQVPKPTGERVRVKAGHANVHTGPTSGNEVLVLAAKGTVLPMLARPGEWVQVGRIHDSMLEVVKPGEKWIKCYRSRILVASLPA